MNNVHYMPVLEICQEMATQFLKENKCYIFLNNRNDVLTLNLTYVIIYKNSVQGAKSAGADVRFDGIVRKMPFREKV